MSLRLEMLQVARLAPRVLEDASGKVAGFLTEQFLDDGSVADRAGNSDLYYTVFGLDGLIALREELPVARTAGYLESFGDGGGLDFVHLACLARCWAAMGASDSHPGPSDEIGAKLTERIESFRSADGGYAADPGGSQGTAYHSFLATGVYQDLGVEQPRVDAMLDSVDALRSTDGAYANAPGLPHGTTTVTAAVVTLLRHFQRPIPETVAPWLFEQCGEAGGFRATPQAPVPDLLSTATALHALVGIHAPIADIQDRCLDFVDSLWTGRAFCGSWADEAQDAEYTFYALLALGHLSL